MKGIGTQIDKIEENSDLNPDRDQGLPGAGVDPGGVMTPDVFLDPDPVGVTTPVFFFTPAPSGS